MASGRFNARLEVKIGAIAGLFLSLALVAFLFITSGNVAPGSGLASYGDGILVALVLMATLVVFAWSYGRVNSSESF